MNRVYISDLDGTLLRNDATLSDYSRRSLTKLINDGIKFTVASARNIYSIKEILGDLPLDSWILESHEIVKNTFGPIRAFGSIGWGISTLVVGKGCQQCSEEEKGR